MATALPVLREPDQGPIDGLPANDLLGDVAGQQDHHLFHDAPLPPAVQAAFVQAGELHAAEALRQGDDGQVFDVGPAAEGVGGPAWPASW